MNTGDQNGQNRHQHFKIVTNTNIDVTIVLSFLSPIFFVGFYGTKNFFWVKNLLGRKPEVLSKSLVLTVYFWF